LAFVHPVLPFIRSTRGIDANFASRSGFFTTF
jgi:hypothetical protein